MIVYNAKEFGQELKKRRQELGFTQGYITDLTGISASYISNLENGKETCELGKAIRLMNLLGMDVSIEPRGQKEAKYGSQ